MYSSQASLNPPLASLNNKYPHIIKMNTELVKSSFYITYVFLMTTGTITFIESLRTPNPLIRHIMNLETCISIIAAYFYSIFIAKINDSKESIPYTDITLTRYIDWMISTPFMLFVLGMILANEKNIPFTFKAFVVILLLDLCMLASGYLAETGRINKITGLVLGFAFFFAMFAYIWMMYMNKGKNTFVATFTYFVFFIVWGIYGVAYMADEQTKNILYNILDLIAKAMMGIFFWMAFTNSITF